MSEAELARAMLAAHDAARLLPLPSAEDAHFDLHAAYRVARAVEGLRIARGERPRGWKIGFTNRGLWPRYGVQRPIWGRVWDSSLTLLDGTRASLSLRGLVQPRIEPEIVFGLRAAPRAGLQAEALRECIGWVAHGFEIVQTHFEGWRFSAPDTVADGGLHGRLLVGPRVDAGDWPSLARDLARLRLQLFKGVRLVEEGEGANVLDGPLEALRQCLDAMQADGAEARFAAGDVVTTGTLTDAWPIAPGEHWHTVLQGPRLAGLALDVQA